MRIIKTFEAYGEPEAGQGKQFKVIKKGKGVMPSTFTSEMISSMWSDLLQATDYNNIPLSVFLKNSDVRDSWENNNIKLTCVQLADEAPQPVPFQEVSDNPEFEIQVTGSVSKRVSTYNLIAEDILKTWNSKHGDEGLEDFVNNAKKGEKWSSKNIVITKL